VEPQASTPTPGERAYPGSAVAAAVVATLFFPVISLIVALFLLSSERDHHKKSMLRAWALAAALWLLVQAVVGVILFAALAPG
jgi:hypothetical protein